LLQVQEPSSPTLLPVLLEFHCQHDLSHVPTFRFTLSCDLFLFPPPPLSFVSSFLHFNCPFVTLLCFLGGVLSAYLYPTLLRCLSTTAPPPPPPPPHIHLNFWFIFCCCSKHQLKSFLNHRRFPPPLLLFLPPPLPPPPTLTTCIYSHIMLAIKHPHGHYDTHTHTHVYIYICVMYRYVCIRITFRLYHHKG
jgi:hypothetical protein